MLYKNFWSRIYSDDYIKTLTTFNVSWEEGSKICKLWITNLLLQLVTKIILCIFIFLEFHYKESWTFPYKFFIVVAAWIQNSLRCFLYLYHQCSSNINVTLVTWVFLIVQIPSTKWGRILKMIILYMII